MRVTKGQLLLDAVLAAGVFGFALLAISRSNFSEGSRDLDALGIALAAVASLPTAARRVAPLPVFVLVTAASSAIYGFDYGLGPPLGFALALYTLAEQPGGTPPLTRRLAYAGSIVALLGPHVVEGEIAPELILGGVVWAAAWFAGDRARLRGERLAELEERARRAEREAERERRLAAAEERTRIARDLHDSAGHAINVILVQAGAARLLRDRDPERSRQALETIEEVARETLHEIDRLVGVLRESGSAAGVEPPAGLAALEMLSERYRAAGLGLTVAVDGERRALPPAVDQAAYRVLQEALTNAARHGSGDVRVELAYGPSALDVTVTNPAAAGAATNGGGHGLAGMRERALLLGGRLDAGAENGVFRVRARLPYGQGAE